MWQRGAVLVAGQAPSAGFSDALIVTVGGIVVAALGALGLVLSEMIKGRNNRSPVQTTPVGVADTRLPERVAVLEDWRSEIKKADDIHDRIVYRVADDVEDLVRWMDREHPDWRP